MEETFTSVYKNNNWGTNNSTEYSGSSGLGSSIEYNKDTWVKVLQKTIKNFNIQSVVDLGCGDFVCGNLIYDDLNVNYTGYDVYADVINFNSKNFPVEKYTFFHLDFFSKKEEIVSGDLCIIKDVLQHWPLEYIYTFLDYLVESKKFKYIFIVNCCNQRYHNSNITLGDFRGLSCDFLPLKKYSPAKLYNYFTKEVSIISCLKK